MLLFYLRGRRNFY